MTPNLQYQHLYDNLPPLLRAAVQEVVGKVKAPIPMVISSALGMASLALQNYADVVRPGGLRSPISLFLLVIAVSGERKSAIDKLFAAPIIEFEAFVQQSQQTQSRRYQADLTEWKIRERQLEYQMAEIIKEGLDTGQIKEELIAHLERKPTEPPSLQMLFSNTTPQGLIAKMSDTWPSVALFSNEGGQIVESGAMRNLGLLNELWDGQTLRQNRKTSAPIHIERPRLTTSLMIQPAVLQKYLQSSGKQARGSGFLARFLVTHPESMMGYRQEAPPYFQPKSWAMNYWTPPPRFNIPAPKRVGLKDFHERLSELLHASWQQRPREREALPSAGFSSSAELLWRDYADWVETELRPSGQLAHYRDYGAKLAENVARVAAILELIDSGTLTISEQNLWNAIRLCGFYVGEFIRFDQYFSAEPAAQHSRSTRSHAQIQQSAQDLSNAHLLLTWLQAKRHETGNPIFSRRTVQKDGPSVFRKGGVTSVVRALAILAERGQVNLNSGKNQYQFSLTTPLQDI
ncbi:YfjI family protein [Chitinimonas sp. BJYL2]|uniref:YfjI family protein n=1 Tax=Chitinimonas sp. BJYL2 TaxID=2976696 RepID=UPI0022B346E7|nr:YfjI family protein [Chitinimonas sp. BJYL2]